MSHGDTPSQRGTAMLKVVFSTGEVWVKYSEAAPKDSLAQSSENLESDAIHKIHVEKDFIIFYTTTPHRCLGFRQKCMGLWSLNSDTRKSKMSSIN